MGYCIEDVIFDSGIDDRLRGSVEMYDGFFSDLLLDEINKLSEMPTPDDVDGRFSGYRDALMGLIIRSAIGCRGLDKVSIGDMMLMVFDRLRDSGCGLDEFVSFKYNDDDGIERTYEYKRDDDEY